MNTRLCREARSPRRWGGGSYHHHCLRPCRAGSQRIATRMPTDAAHKRGWQIFEVIFGLPFLPGIGLPSAVPASLPHGFLAPFIAAGGASLVAAGIAFIVLPRGELAQHGQPTDPGFPTGELVTTVSSRSRGTPLSRRHLSSGRDCAGVQSPVVIRTSPASTALRLPLSSHCAGRGVPCTPNSMESTSSTRPQSAAGSVTCEIDVVVSIAQSGSSWRRKKHAQQCPPYLAPPS